MTPTQARKQKLALEQERSRTLEATVKDLESELRVLRATASVFLSELPRAVAAEALECEDHGPVPECQIVATQALEWEGDGGHFCDHCAERQDLPPLHRKDLPHAAPFRTLRKLLGGEP